MKVLYISSSTIPSKDANSVQVTKMCDALSRSGHKVLLLGKKGGANENLYDYYNLGSKFPIKRTRISNPFLSLFFYVFYLIKFKPDLIYCRNIYGSYISAVLGFPVCLEIHDDRWRRGKIAPYLYRSLNRNQNLKKVISITKVLLDEYRQDWKDTVCKEMKVLPDAADIPDLGLIKKNTDRNNKVLNVGYVGGFYKGKGLEVIEKIAPHLEDVVFHIVGGSGDLLEYWKNKIQYNNVVFYGYVEQKKINSCYNKMDVCLLPNQVMSHGVSDSATNISKFTSPLKLFEYMSYKKAIIASDLPVFSEVLENGKNCILVKPDDYEGWVNAINFLKDSHERNRLQTNAYEEFINKYTWDKRAENLFIGNEC